jgi:hypothetical protein
MIKIVLRVIGVLFVVGALLAAWFGFEAHEDMQKWNSESIKQQSENNSPRRRPDGEQKLAEDLEQIEKKKVERNIWLGAATGALVVGLGMVLLPSSRKRKAPRAEPVSAPAPDQPAPLGDQPTPAGQ